MIRLLLVSVAVVAIAAGVWAQAPVSTPSLPQASSTAASIPAWTPPPGHLSMAIWPGTPPGATANLPPESDENVTGTKQVAGRPYVRLTNVSTPTITLFKPTGKNTGAAVVVFPGGGYQIIAYDLEGTEVCDWLNSIGVNCALVKYRVPNAGPFPKYTQDLADAQRAVRVVRQHASQWQLDPNRVGVLGFSAGGHLV